MYSDSDIQPPDFLKDFRFRIVHSYLNVAPVYIPVFNPEGMALL